jgi:hypothetical protein
MQGSVHLKTRNKILLISLAAVLLLAASLFLSKASGFFSSIPLPLQTAPELLQASKGLNKYDIEVEFDPDAKRLICSQRVNYINKTGKSLTHLYFHLYPNAYKYENKPVFEKSDMVRAYPNGFSPGYLNLHKVLAAGKEVEYIIDGYSDNILMIILNEDLNTGDALNIEMEYTVQLPNCLGRFGYGDNMYKIVNWYPIACVYDEKGWNLDPYYAVGDPFYSDAANYRVSIYAPADYTIAATGEHVSKKEKGDFSLWEIYAPAVRDFAWMAGNTFQTVTRKAGRTTVTSYYYTPESGEKALDYAAESLAIFNDIFGEYPYSRFEVVESDFYIGGMEYPNLIMLDHSLYEDDSSYLELIAVHETAHQWWYGLVGSNQIQDAWIDEGLTEYSTILYYGQRYGPDKEKEMYESIMGKGKYRMLSLLLDIYRDAANDFSNGIDETIHRPVYEFSDWKIYDLLVYGKGAMLFHSLREELGDELFFKGLQRYFQEFIFKNVKKSDLINAFNKISNDNWDEFFDRWLYDELIY